MIAIYSLYEDYKEKVNGGFKSKKDLASTLTLSVLESKKQFKQVNFYTNKFGKELVDYYQIPFDNVFLVLDKFDNVLHPNLWAYIKIYVYSLQREPFIHIDNDVILWDKIPESYNQYDLFFQNKEHLLTHRGYKGLLEKASKFPVVNQDIINCKPSYAFNCGIVAGKNLDLIKRWHDIVYEFIFSEGNIKSWEQTKDKHSMNHLFEQYFISCLIHLENNLNIGTLLTDDFYKSALRDFKMTHLWGEAKREQRVMDKITFRLKRDYIDFYKLLNKKQSHSIVFDDIYRNEIWGKGQGSGGGSSPEITKEYREYLSNVLSKQDINSVVDLGCGDWQFSKLIDWSKVNYLGLDCVQKLIDENKKLYGSENINFLYNDSTEEFDYEGDLLIVKDVFIHWPNRQIINFINKIIKQKSFKYLLITNQNKKDYLLNKDISIGEFHNLDFNQPPFNFNFDILFNWSNDSKVTYLVKLK